ARTEQRAERMAAEEDRRRAGYGVRCIDDRVDVVDEHVVREVRDERDVAALVEYRATRDARVERESELTAEIPVDAEIRVVLAVGERAAEIVLELVGAPVERPHF